MPNKWTFTIKPIKELINWHCLSGRGWVDPFAGMCSPACVKNDLNPESNAEHHQDALLFLQSLESYKYMGVLYDPPYSITQATQCYKSYGKDKLEITPNNMKYWAECKNQIARIVKDEGIVICCGWNSNGLGKGRGFEMLEVLLVVHGGSKNDTIVTVERKSKKVKKEVDLIYESEGLD